MSGRIVVAVAVCWFALCSCGRSNDAGGFDRYFRLVRTITLPDSVLLTHVNGLDVDEHGRMLITDLFQNEVDLFDGDGSFVKTLSAEPCHPGISWRPGAARFAPDGSILVVNLAPPSFRFSIDGECVAAMDDSFLPPTSFDFDEEGSIYGFFSRTDGYFVEVMDGMGREVQRIAEGQRFAAFVDRFKSGGLIYDAGTVYLALPFSPYVFRFADSGAARGHVGTRPSYFRELKDDIRNIQKDTRTLIAEMRDRLYGSSFSKNLFLLDGGIAVVQYWNGYNQYDKPSERYGIAVIDAVDGTNLTGEVLVEHPIDFAGNGLLYRAAQIEGDEEGAGFNPLIEVFELVPNIQR